MSKSDALLIPAVIGGGNYYANITLPYEGASVQKHYCERGSAVRCHICGASGKTLYKCGDGYICVECRRNENE